MEQEKIFKLFKKFAGDVIDLHGLKLTLTAVGKRGMINEKNVMYFDIFKYDSKWTESWESYNVYRPDLCRAIMTHMDYYNTRLPQLKQQTASLTTNFFSAGDMLRNIK